MKKILTLIFFMIVCLVNAQVRVTGRVVDQNNRPLQGAAVYINNTSIGTSSSLKGYFELYVEHGKYNLIVSYLGYQTVQYSLNTLSLPNKIIFKLKSENKQLNEIVIKKKKKISKSKRAYYMRLFKENFIGRSFNAESTHIKNEYAIEFDFDPIEEILEVSTSEPLIIKNSALGYRITYDLVHFELKYLGVTYLGYTRYEELEGSKRKKRKWEKQRQVSYNGSVMHFIKSLIKRDTLSGFELDEVRLIPNPDRPTDQEILKADKLLKENGGLQQNPYNRDVTLERNLNWAKDIRQRAKLKRYIDITIRSNLKFNHFFGEKDGVYYIKSNNALRVRYMNEYAESKYSSIYSGIDHQQSKLTLYNEKALLNPIGVFQNPLNVLLEGYWAFEKVGDQLPLDYKP